MKYWNEQEYNKLNMDEEEEVTIHGEMYQIGHATASTQTYFPDYCLTDKLRVIDMCLNILATTNPKLPSGIKKTATEKLKHYLNNI